MVISAYRSGTEFIEIERAENGKYFVNYGIEFVKGYERKKISNSAAGAFNSFSDAVTALKKHRPQAEQIKKFCADCRFRKMLTWDSSTGKTESAHCNGIPANECYTWCVHKS